jgi:hypothetical protein
VHDVETADGSREYDVQAVQAAWFGGDDAGRLGDHDGVELEALREGCRDADESRRVHLLVGFAEERGL